MILCHVRSRDQEDIYKMDSLRPVAACDGPILSYGATTGIRKVSEGQHSQNWPVGSFICPDFGKLTMLSHLVFQEIRILNIEGAVVL